jgi:hypothetical protein
MGICERPRKMGMRRWGRERENLLKLESSTSTKIKQQQKGKNSHAPK